MADEFGDDALALDTPEAAQRAIERARSLADESGIQGDDDVRTILRCMVLVGSDLSRSSGIDADIRLTLGMTDRPAEQRARRITRIAQTAADEQGGPAGISTLADGPAAPASPPPGRVPPPPVSPDGADAPPVEAERAAPQTESPTPPADPVSDPIPDPIPDPVPDPVPDPEPEPVSNPLPEPPPNQAAEAAPESTRKGPQLEAPAPEPTRAPPRAPAPEPARPKNVPPSRPSRQEQAADAIADIPGYTDVEPVGGSFRGRDATTGERVLAFAARGEPDAALDRLGLASRIIHRNLEKITDSVVGSIESAPSTFAVVTDHELATLDAIRPRLSAASLAAAPPDAVIQAFLLTEGALAPHLAQIVSEKNRVHERLVLTWAAEVADAVQAAHHAGIAHGAIDDSMVMLDRHGVLVLRGLGLADPEDPSLDAFMPEQIKSVSPERIAAAADGEPLRPEHAPLADIWSLGVVVYCLLTGRPPYEGHRSALLRDIATREPEPPASVTEGLSDAAADACGVALIRDPAARVASMADFAETLRAAASPEAGGKRKKGLFGRKS